MRRTEGLASVWVFASIAIAFSLYALLIGPPAAFATTTTTVIGWLIPDGSHFNNGIGALLYPLAGIGLFAGMAKVLDLEGEFGVTLILAGITIGAVLAMLSINASSASVMPFALAIVPGIDLLLWMWKGGG